MDYEKLQIDLKREEQILLDEILEIQDKIKDNDPAKMNGQLLSAIQAKSIETITMALGVSDIFENTAHANGLAFKKEYSEYQKWENTPLNERSTSYKTKYVHKDEFKGLLEKEIPKYNRESYVGKGPGTSQRETTDKKWRDSLDKGGVNDAYTGKFIKNGEPNKREAYEWDHVKSAKEVHDDPVLNYVLNKKEKRDLLNSEENIVPTKAGINNQKRDVKIEDFEKWQNSRSKKDPTKTNKEYFGIDEKNSKEAFEQSKRKENEILKNKTKVYELKTQAKVACSNAVKSGAKAAIGQLLTITIVEVVNEYKNEEDIELKQRIKNISIRIKEKAKGLLSTFTDHSISSFLSTFLDAILNSLFKIAKNIFKFVKQAILSIFKALKILFSSQYTWEVKLKEVLKLLGITVASLIGIALDEIIEKALITNFPFTAPFAGLISPVLSGLIVGIGSVLILQGFQKYQSQITFRKLQGEENTKQQKRSKINIAIAGGSDVMATEAVGLSLSIFRGTLPIIASCKNQIDESILNIRDTTNTISENISGIKKMNEDNENLLNLLENS
ncbi:hypothetical protein [Arenibacter lacus]|uniref:hypothetical protein n=1 Tax=Arenibacter lacus TaxID=2608629 RepID=UPI00123D62F4|nr:hypothetical protein [Arenibacter lacus]